MPYPTDGRDSVTRGNGAIVLRLANNYAFHEHASITNAKAEAARLAGQLGGDYVVYVPVARISPAPKTVTTDLVTPTLLDELRSAEAGDEYPF